jgi:adenylate cyclase
LAQPDHADRALAAACEMLGVRLSRFNDWAREHGIADGFQMGIGLNSGTFMAGNVGSLQRLEYTVIGDTTNTAARLEGMTKGSGHSLFLSESTRQRLSDGGPAIEFVDELAVRGRKAAIRVWGLTRANGDDAPVGDERTPTTDSERWAPA